MRGSQTFRLEHFRVPIGWPIDRLRIEVKNQCPQAGALSLIANALPDCYNLASTLREEPRVYLIFSELSFNWRQYFNKYRFQSPRSQVQVHDTTDMKTRQNVCFGKYVQE